MERTRLVALTVTVAATLGTVLAVGARPGTAPAPVAPADGASSGPRPVALASGVPVHVRAANRAW